MDHPDKSMCQFELKFQQRGTNVLYSANLFINDCPFELDLREHLTRRCSPTNRDSVYSFRRRSKKMSLETERSFLEAFRRGESWALEKVYRQHVKQVASFLRRGFSFESRGVAMRYRGVTSHFQLEDWVHDVFVRAFSDTSRAQYDGVRPFGPYLERIARNIVIDEQKRKEHQLREHFSVLPEPSSTGNFEMSRSQNPEESFFDTQLSEHVQKYVESLPPREKNVYVLRFVEGLDQSEVAKRTGLTPSKVKTSERRIRERFFGYLKKLGWIDNETSSQKEAESSLELTLNASEYSTLRHAHRRK